MRLVLEWTLATATALAISMLIIEVLFFAVLGCLLLWLLPVVGGLIGGVLVGFFQWMVLRRRFRGSGAWIVATSLGMLAASILGALLFVALASMQARGAFWFFVICAIPTPAIGIAQASVLRRWTSQTRIWVLASTAGWIVFAAVIALAGRSLPAVSNLAASLVGMIAGYEVTSLVGATLLGGLAAGLITGIGLDRCTTISP